ncbi:MAG: metallophosphoesterase [Planctomycetes bacterium]|nr:metallophosphoesterase [Planctomycetota bacterium]
MPLLFNTWRLLPQRIALHEPSATAVIADVHLGYSAARQRQGDAVPLRAVAEEMQPLLDAARAVNLRGLLVAGDLFERGFDPELYQQFSAVLKQAHIDFLGLIPGNHDRGIDTTALPTFAGGYDLAGWQIVHGDQPVEARRAVMGHWHPAIKVRGRKTPCFLLKNEHLVLPAFSLDAAGVDIRKEARWRGWEYFAIETGTSIRNGVGCLLS